MKTLITSIMVPLMVIIGAVADNSALAGDQGNNTHYQTMRIKHRAQMGFDNNGRSVYKYISDKDIPNGSHNIGQYAVPQGSSVREVYLGVDLRQRVKIVNQNKGTPLKIGTITNGKQLKKARVNVRVAGPIKYK
jgi:hypothetical protein